MEWAVDAASWVCLVGGAVFCVIGGIGLLRLPDVFARMHAAGVADTLGASLVLIGLVLQAGLTLVAVKLVMILLFLFVTGPTASHALARAALHRGVEPLLAPEDEAS